MGGGLGNILALISGIAYAGVFMLNDMPDSDAISSVFWGDVLSAITGLPFLFLENDFSFVPLTSLLVLGVFQVAVAYILLTIGLKTTPPVTASLVSGIEPVLNPILVAVFYQEKMGSMALVGAGIVIFGVISYNLLKIRQDTKELST
jgi:drug/metabolite transporter (DMT)-like permease